MRMLIDPVSLTTPQVQMILEHNGEKTYWNVSSYDKRCFTGEYDVCKHINEYWAKQPAYRQEKIFNIFLQIRNTFEDVYNATALIDALVDQVAGLFEEHKLEEIELWMNFHSDILFPEKLEDEYVASDEKPGNREKTYLRNDYKRLVVIAIALRIMIPIWGEFIYRTRKETGTYFKEYYAYKLLNKTHLVTSSAMQKLTTYVIHNIQADRPVYNIVISGVGTEAFPEWLLSMVIVRRLCVGDVRGVNPLTSLVTFIYNYINQKVTGNNTGNFATMVKGKEFESSMSDDHNASRLEGYKIKLKAPIGDLAILEHYMDNPINVALKLNPNTDLNLLNDFIRSSKTLLNEQVLLPQVTLAQYVMRPVISPRGLTHLNKAQVVNAIAISQTWLWQHGHQVLAGLISAIPTNNDTETMISSVDSKARIPRELADQINLVFPYTKVNATRKKTKTFNAVVLAIDELSNLFSQRDWIITMFPDIAKEITGHANIVRMGCPHDIKILLAKLILDLAKTR